MGNFPQFGELAYWQRIGRRAGLVLLCCAPLPGVAADPGTDDGVQPPTPLFAVPPIRSVAAPDSGESAAKAASRRPAISLDSSAPPTTSDSWLAWQRANNGGKERWSALMFLGDDRTSCLGVQCQTAKAVKPGGINDLPPLVPALTWSQELLPGVAIQGSVGQNVPMSWRAVEQLKAQPLYGVSVQLTPETTLGPLPRMQVTVDTTGRPVGSSASAEPAHQWEMAPTLRLQSGANSWLSGGFLVPLERGRSTPDSWQLNWSWQY